MNQLVPILADRAPAVVAAAGERASYRFLEFFTANIRNPHTGEGILAVDFVQWPSTLGLQSGLNKIPAFAVRPRRL